MIRHPETFSPIGKTGSSSYLGWLAGKLLSGRRNKIAGGHWLTFSGIALGVFALLTVSSVMNGFDQDMSQRVIGTRSEIRLDNPDSSPLRHYQAILGQIKQQPGVRAAAPVIRNELMLVKGSGLAATVCFGIDLEQHRQVSRVLEPLNLKQVLDPGREWNQGIINGNPQQSDLAGGGIILGAELARSIEAAVGDTVRLVSPLGSVPTPLGLLPKTRALRVCGIFIAGMPEYDRLYSYVDLGTAGFFSSYQGQIDHIDIVTRAPDRLTQVTRQLAGAFPKLRIENWSQFDSSLYAAIHFEKYIMLVILGLMFVIASFNMSGNMFRNIVRKRRSIGILKTLGCRSGDIIALFVRQGLIIALAGILAGILLSLLALFLQARFGIVHLPVGNLPDLVLPVDIRWQDYLAIPLAALLLTGLSIYLPARKAGQVDPIVLIREIT